MTMFRRMTLLAALMWMAAFSWVPARRPTMVLFDLISSRSPELPDHPAPSVPSMWMTRAWPSEAYRWRSAKVVTTMGAAVPPPVTLKAPPVRQVRVAQPMGRH